MPLRGCSQTSAQFCDRAATDYDHSIERTYKCYHLLMLLFSNQSLPQNATKQGFPTAFPKCALYTTKRRISAVTLICSWVSSNLYITILSVTVLAVPLLPLPWSWHRSCFSVLPFAVSSRYRATFLPITARFVLPTCLMLFDTDVGKLPAPSPC